MRDENRTPKQNSPSPGSFWYYWRPVRRFLRKYSSLIVLTLSIIAFVAAFVGVYERSEADHFKSFTDCVYEAAQILLLNMEAHQANGYNIWIGIARLAAVLLVGFIAFRAISKLFRDFFSNIRLFCGQFRRTVFVAGMGRVGFEVASDLANRSELVVAMEISEPNFWTELAEDFGVIVRPGDVNDADGLREHILRDPKKIYLVTGHDLANLNALATIRTLRNSRREWRRKLAVTNCYVHIAEPGLQSALHRGLLQNSFAADPDLNIHIFNIYHETACQLILEQLTPLRPQHRDEVALYIIFGTGNMVRAMVKELAEYAHFENLKRSRILVLSSNAEEDCERCLSQWNRLSPKFVHRDLASVRFDPACDEWGNQTCRPSIFAQANDFQAAEYAANVHFCQIATDETLSQADVAQLVRLATETNVRAAAMFCYEDDDRNYRLASEMNDMLQDFHGINKVLDFSGPDGEKRRAASQRQTEFCLHIFVFLPRSRPLQQILRESTARYRMQAFGIVSEALERVHDTLVEEVAMDIAANYDRLPRDGYEKVWAQKSYWEQHSNLSAAEHARIKVQLLGYEFTPFADSHSVTIKADQFSIQEKSTIKLVEHNRWMAERLLLGWTYGPRMDQPPQRDSLTSKDAIKPEELEKDFEQIIAVLKHFERRGLFFRKISDNGCQCNKT